MSEFTYRLALIKILLGPVKKTTLYLSFSDLQQTFVRHPSHLPKCQFEVRKDWKGPFFQSKAGEMKPFKPNRSFYCLSKAWFYCSNIRFWNYKLLFGQTTMGRIHAFCRKADYVANTRFLGFVLTQIFRILLRFYSDFTQISVQKLAAGGSGWEDKQLEGQINI